MVIVTNDRAVIRYVYGRPFSSKPIREINNVHIFSMSSTRNLFFCISVAAVVSLYSTSVTFRYQNQNDIDY